jgi:hypothetical protein
MANRYYSVLLGEQTPSLVTEGSSTSSEAIELRVEFDASGMDKITVLKGLKALEMYIIQDAWPPNT